MSPTGSVRSASLYPSLTSIESDFSDLPAISSLSQHSKRRLPNMHSTLLHRQSSDIVALAHEQMRRYRNERKDLLAALDRQHELLQRASSRLKNRQETSDSTIQGLQRDLHEKVSASPPAGFSARAPSHLDTHTLHASSHIGADSNSKDFLYRHPDIEVATPCGSDDFDATDHRIVVCVTCQAYLWVHNNCVLYSCPFCSHMASSMGGNRL
jgi:hypothetical protein